MGTINIHEEAKKVAKILTSLDLKMDEHGLFCDNQGPVHHNAIVVRILRDYDSPLTQSASRKLVTSVVTRFRESSMKALRIKCSS